MMIQQTDKTFILSPFNDETYFTKITNSKFHIIEYDGVLKKIPSSNSKQINEFLFDKEISNLLKPVVSNKKFRNLIFIIRVLDPDAVRKKITELTANLNPGLKVGFNLIVSKHDLEDYEYEVGEYSSIFVHDEE